MYSRIMSNQIHINAAVVGIKVLTNYKWSLVLCSHDSDTWHHLTDR